MTFSQRYKKFKGVLKIGSWGLVLSILGALLSATAMYFMLISIGTISETVMIQLKGNYYDIEPFIRVGLIMLSLMPFLVLFQTLNLIGGQLAEKGLLKRILEFVSKTKYSNIDHSGSVMNILTSEAGTINDFYFQGINNSVINPIAVGMISLVSCFIIDVRFGLVAIAIGLLSMASGLTSSKSIQKYHERIKVANEEATTVFSEALSNETFFRINALNTSAYNMVDSSNDSVQDLRFGVEKKNSKVSTIGEGFNYLSTFLFLLVGLYLSVKGIQDFSKVLLLLPLQNSISNMFTSLPLVVNYLSDVMASSSVMMDFLNQDVEAFVDSKIDNQRDIDLSFENVSFSYDLQTMILNDISFDIPANKKVAFVGGSGSGKSTLLKLILGLYEPTEGRIVVSNSTNPFEYRKKIAYVQQESPLFQKTIRENIAFGISDSADNIDDLIVEAAKKAAIHDFIMSLPQGYETMVTSNASSLSGGQRQRIALARAFATDASIILLDEPTSALDHASQTAIQQAISNVKGSKTIIIVAHRLSTITDSDTIYVMDHGKIIESGNHLELLKAKGYYANLYDQDNNKSNVDTKTE